MLQNLFTVKNTERKGYCQPGSGKEGGPSPGFPENFPGCVKRRPLPSRFSTVTETPGVGASREQWSMLYTRYRFAAPFCKGKEVLEVGCGAGLGLGYLARAAARVVGGDVDEANLRLAARRYRERPNVEVRKINAHRLPFEGERFDAALLYEAIYYLERPERFLEECRRVLRKEGVLLISTVNREWPDFNPSPFSARYFSSRELAALLQGSGFDAALYAAFPAGAKSVRDRIVSLLKRGAVSLGLIPKTMRGKTFLKRIFFGSLSPLPPEVEEGMAEYAAPIPISPQEPCLNYKILYAVARPAGRKEGAS